MSLFIRNQFGPYRTEVEVERTTPRGLRWTDQMVLPTFTTSGPCPHGRNANTGEASDWGPNEYGYTDFDDYHLELYGA